jgi:membrane fusion protein, multidrug efflux system
LLLISACRGADTPKYAVEATRVEVAKVSVDEMAETVALHGQVTVPAGRLTQLSSLEPGYLTRFACTEGEFVHAGQVLAEIAAGSSEAQLQEARARLVEAQAKSLEASARADREQALLAQGAASTREQQNAVAEAKIAEAAVQEARAAVGAAEKHLDHTAIRAPFDGRVLRLMSTVGEALPGSGQPVLEMADLSVFELAALASSDDASRLVIGQTAQVHLDALPSETFAGSVASLSPGLDLAAGVIRVRVRIDTTGHGTGVRLGLWGVADVQVGKRSGVVRLPVSALQLNEGEPTARVLVLTPDGHHVTSREIHLGLRSTGAVEVKQGLTPGEWVVTHGGYGLPDGAQVVTGATP